MMTEKKARANREKGGKHTSGESLYNLTPDHPPRGRIIIIIIIITRVPLCKLHES